MNIVSLESISKFNLSGHPTEDLTASEQSTSNLANGDYFYTIHIDDTPEKTGKIIISK